MTNNNNYYRALNRTDKTYNNLCSSTLFMSLCSLSATALFLLAFYQNNSGLSQNINTSNSDIPTNATFWVTNPSMVHSTISSNFLN